MRDIIIALAVALPLAAALAAIGVSAVGEARANGEITEA